MIGNMIGNTFCLIMQVSFLCFMAFLERFILNVFIYHTGHYDVSEESIILSSNNLSSGDKNHVWTFRANTNQRINFHFPKYFFSFNVYEIGDGMNKSSPTRLARFKGIDYPSNVTSVSNCAWFSVDVLYLHRFSPTHLFHILG